MRYWSITPKKYKQGSLLQNNCIKVMFFLSFELPLQYYFVPFEKIVRICLVKSSLVFVLVESVQLNALKFFHEETDTFFGLILSSLTLNGIFYFSFHIDFPFIIQISSHESRFLS